MTNITATSGNERLVEASSADSIDGAAGNDTLVGGLGSNTFYGGDGNDVICTGNASSAVTGSTADDVFGGNGNDDIHVTEIGSGVATIDGGAGIGTVFFEFDTLSLARGLSSGGEAERDTLTGIKNLTGPAFNDAASGDTAANVLDGGAGADTLDHSASSAAVSVSLASGFGLGGLFDHPRVGTFDNRGDGPARFACEGAR